MYTGGFAVGASSVLRVRGIHLAEIYRKHVAAEVELQRQV
jgi:hypothetical protein